MGQMPRYSIIYTETAAQNIMGKAAYIAQQLRAPDLADKWYTRLQATIWECSSVFPMKSAL